MTAPAAYRRLALLALVRACGNERAAVLLNRHPDREQLCAHIESEKAHSLAAVLWDELHGAERVAGNPPEPANETARMRQGYWLRRRFINDLERLRRIGGPSLPGCWFQLATTPRPAFGQVFAAIGCEMIANTTLLQPPDRVPRWLAPLGSRMARSIVDRLPSIVGRRAPRRLAERWADVFAGCRRSSLTHRIPRQLGAALVAEAAEALSPSTRQALVRLLGQIPMETPKIVPSDGLYASEADAFLIRTVELFRQGIIGGTEEEENDPAVRPTESRSDRPPSGGRGSAVVPARAAAQE